MYTYILIMDVMMINRACVPTSFVQDCSMVRKAKEKYCKESVFKCNGDSKKLWKTLHDILPSKESPTPSTITVDGEVYTSHRVTTRTFIQLRRNGRRQVKNFECA